MIKNDRTLKKIINDLKHKENKSVESYEIENITTEGLEKWIAAIEVEHIKVVT